MEGRVGVIIVTGASGFLGTHIVAELLQREMLILALVRAAPGRAEARLARAWWDWPELAALIGSRIQACPGDITMPDLGLSSAALGLARNATHVVHAAADIRLAASLDELRRINRDGTARMLEFATSLPGLSHFVHISTAYVAGACPGPVIEENLSDAYGFRSPYEMSKYEGEQFVRAAMAQMPITVARPGMVVGHSETGAVKAFNTLYLPLRLYLSGRLPVIPARASLRMPMVPVDYVARSVASLLLDPRAMGATVHLVPPTDACPCAAALLTTVQGWARKNLGLRLRRPLFVPLPLPRRLKTWRMSDPPTGKLRALLPYVEGPVFRRGTADRLLGPYPHDWHSLVPPMLAFAVNNGFLHRSERTVQEQVMFRLGRSSRPVFFHDVVGGRARTRRGPVVRQDIEKVRHALCAMGVGQGHSVAIIGPNSTRYVTIDVAIGLAGAVSVPLHPATPADELRSLLGSSEARLLFIGCPVMEGGLEGLGIPVVSFADAPPRDQAILRWEQFLALGAQGDAVPMVRPHDPATRRHTSGTTGGPQGVVFNHRNVRWMAECLASLFPWRWRIRPARYLSFLPMNHVVEGILATYAPYYLPAPVDIYFLDDIHELPRALRVARPTVFFSVPRFYEKVWAAFSSRPAGRWYCGHSRSAAAKLVRPLLRRALLGRVGLHRCRYLIAGSAPSDHGLLCRFQDLGIEIHDAYGLTEAPLVTLNRLGRNRIGTVGQPLPETEVLIVDGEILVRGPQVARSLLDASGGTGRWLSTGDLGHRTEDGYLVIDGRRKELIATSYGKKVPIGRIEAALRGIPGVADVMLVGEGRPYCVALLWVGQAWTTELRAAIDRGMNEVNRQLARPEQVRRWAVVSGCLSIQRGELTANLKVRRQAVAAAHEAIIEGLYQGSPLPGVHHVGTLFSEAGS